MWTGSGNLSVLFGEGGENCVKIFLFADSRDGSMGRFCIFTYMKTHKKSTKCR